MKFRTEIEIAPLDVRFGYENRTLALGSCFASHIADRLARARFHVTANPTGILFNPLSIAAAVRAFGTEVRREELQHDAERWFHFGFHGDFAAPTAEEALRRMNAARRAGAGALRAADRVILTLGTAWVYEREGEVVANCHRRPAAEFTRRRLPVAEIVETLAALIEGPFAGKEVLLTVSPVRHLGDGLAGNAVSKATLRLAAEELAGGFRNVAYFPSYEILMDDLRDYRFYADDLVHPAPLEQKDVFGITFEQGHNDCKIDESLLTNIVTENKDLPKGAKRDMLLALITLKYTQSNSVCYVKDAQTVGVGAGQQSRIHCTRLAGQKADNWYLRRHPKVLALSFVDGIRRPDRDNAIDVYLSDECDDVLADGAWQHIFKERPEALTGEEKRAWLAQQRGVTVGSDAFFPFGDNVERARRSGASYIVEPGGSIRDDNVIETANKHGITMAFTGMRLFHH